MHEIASHAYTPVRDPYDDDGSFAANVACVACPMPAAEHLDDDVVDSYAGARRLAAESGSSLSVLLTCGHTVGSFHPASSIWDHPDDTPRCPTCNQQCAMAELPIDEAA